MVVHTCNPLEAEAEGSKVQDQSGLHSKTLSQKTKQKNYQVILIKHSLQYQFFHLKEMETI
jgi:hypothetical protein